MKIELKRLTSNHLYTQGKLAVNGGEFCNTVEHTLSMLPIGEYIIQLKKVSLSRRKMVITPVKPLPFAYDQPYFIETGNSWRDSLAKSIIVIGESLIPGSVKKSPSYYDLLFERMEKSKTPITLTILDDECREDKPIQFWFSRSDHGCPPKRQ